MTTATAANPAEATVAPEGRWFNPSRSITGVLVTCGLVGGILLEGGRRDYPELHTILDAAMFVLSAVLALFLWDIGTRISGSLSAWFALAFGVTSAAEGVHVLVAVEWSGALGAIGTWRGVLRPGTWPASAYVLPLAVGGAVLLVRRGWRGGGRLAFALLGAGVAVGMFEIFTSLPRYAAPTWLGITRPSLALIPLLWLVVGSLCWQSRRLDRVLPTMALVACVLAVAHGSMLYSRAPDDTPAMIAHLGKVGGYLTLLLSLSQAASLDLVDRVRAERELAQLNRQLEQRVLDQTEELRRSNAELEQFAYVASHDLQEPLRTVSSYVLLLARRYRDQLGGDAAEFIDFAVQGTTRMQRLIEDLLAFSRVGTRRALPAPTDPEAALTRTLEGLTAALEEAGGTVTHDPLPPVLVDPVQLEQLFGNLVGNALKFRGAEAPRVHLRATREGKHQVFSVRDNGIGIDPKYFDHIFVIFQRLHGPDEYPGTGMGLAIARKIVERHGGRIWVESEPGRGTTFLFTLPAAPES